MSRFIFITLILFLSGCAFLQKRLAVKELKFSLQSIVVRNLTVQTLEMEVNLKAFNPNDVEAVLDRMDYVIYFEGVKAFYGSTDKTYKIAPKGSKIVKVSARIDFVDLPNVFKAIKSAMNKRKVKIKAELTPRIKTPLGNLSHRLVVERYIPLYWK